MALQTSIGGILQVDILVITAIREGLKLLRENPELLDYVFASLPQDELTSKRYGQQNINAAKSWFLGVENIAGGTEVPVRLNIANQKFKMPCITVEIRDSSEVESTLADIHYDPSETYELPWPAVSKTFAATSYDASTGYVGIPESITSETMIFPGMVIVDRAGASHTIVGSIDANTVEIAPAVADFAMAVIKHKKPTIAATLESTEFRTTVTIGVHAQGEVEKTIWLSSIVQFILLRYRQALLEGRGLDRTSLQIGGLTVDQNTSPGELIYSQTMALTGFYRNYWPKFIGPTVQGILPALQFLNDGPSPDGMDVSDAMWNEDQDVLAGVQPFGIKGKFDDSE